MDVVVAFLQAHIDKDVYVKPAPGHDPRDPKTGEAMVYKLERSLYGLAQSPVLWYDTIDGVLIVIGFSPTHSHPCVYVHGSGDTLIILTLYVDDILLTGKDPVLADQKKRELKERFEMTDMGEVTRILGMEVKHDYDQGTLAITQTDYVENLLERFEMQNANVAHTPGYGQTTWSARNQALPVHHGQPALSRTMHAVRPVLRGESTHESMQQAGRPSRNA